MSSKDRLCKRSTTESGQRGEGRTRRADKKRDVSCGTKKQAQRTGGGRSSLCTFARSSIGQGLSTAEITWDSEGRGSVR